MLHAAGGVVGDFFDCFGQCLITEGKEVGGDHRILEAGRRLGSKPVGNDSAQLPLPGVEVGPKDF